MPKTGHNPPSKGSRSANNAVHKFRRTWLLDSYAIDDTAGGVAKAYSFQLSDIPSSTEFTNLFDQYRIRNVKIMLSVSRRNAPAVNATLHAATVPMTPLLLDVVDYDDANALTLAGIEQYENLKITPLDGSRLITRTLKPHVAVASYSGTFVSYANMTDQWIDCNSPAVQHYGWKSVIRGDLEGSAGAYVYGATNIYATYELEFRNVR